MRRWSAHLSYPGLGRMNVLPHDVPTCPSCTHIRLLLDLSQWLIQLLMICIENKYLLSPDMSISLEVSCVSSLLILYCWWNFHPSPFYALVFLESLSDGVFTMTDWSRRAIVLDTGDEYGWGWYERFLVIPARELVPSNEFPYPETWNNKCKMKIVF